MSTTYLVMSKICMNLMLCFLLVGGFTLWWASWCKKREQDDIVGKLKGVARQSFIFSAVSFVCALVFFFF